MASVALTQLWLHYADDPSTYRAFDIVDLKVATSNTVDVRKAANGRLRAFTRPGVQRKLTCTVQFADRADVQWLEDNSATLLMVRDYTGRLFYGIYDTAEASENGFVDRADVPLTITEVSYTDTV